jgi:hypothetical protein
MSSGRDAVIAAFLRANGWGDAERRRLAGDASFRKYDRIAARDRTIVLMDAPPPQEDVRPFVRIARHLHGHGFSVPQVHAEDAGAGLLLLEDLGDDTYTRLLAAGVDEGPLYANAVDALIALHRLPEEAAVPAGVSPYGLPRLLEEVNRLHTWYLPLVGAPPLSDEAKRAYEEIWRAILPLAWKAPASLVLFDYHVDNLLRLEGREGMRACGILDFQDAVVGPVTYDLMSLLEDARRDLSPALVATMRTRYLAAFPAIDRTAFDVSWDVMAAQRHVRVIGTFARLKLRDSKPHYLVHMPRLWRYMDRCLTQPALADLKAWLDLHVPPEHRVVPS